MAALDLPAQLYGAAHIELGDKEQKARLTKEYERAR